MFGFLNNMKVRKKLIILVSTFIIGFLIFGIYSYTAFNKVKVGGNLYNQIAMGNELVADILPPPEYIIESYLVVLQLSNEDDKTKQDFLISECKRLRNEFDTRHSHWEKNLPDGRLKDIIVNEAYKSAVDFFDMRDREFIPAITSGNKAKAIELAQGALKQKYEEHRSKIDEAVKIANQNNAKYVESANKEISLSNIILLTICFVVVIFVLILSFFLNASITRPLNFAIRELSEGSNQIVSASNQLSSASQKLAEANSELAASIQETSATLEQSSSMVKQNSQNTKQAATLAAQAKEASERGDAEMKEMMDSMSEIKRSSDEIAYIIKVIDEIAFQTNILALNAAVEAARAGEAGLGFAVVAEEVRNLAQRSAQAAKDTSLIIQSNIELSEKGVNVARKVGESLAEIELQARKVNELMDEIAAASQEQAQGINQINKAMSQMEKATQQNASNAEESASASEELNAQAGSLTEIVHQLVMLVNGRDEGKYSMAGSVPKLQKGIKINNAIEAKRPASPRIANKTNLSKEVGKTHIIDPEEIIPLEEDSKDF